MPDQLMGGDLKRAVLVLIAVLGMLIVLAVAFAGIMLYSLLRL